ncbi:MAG: alpha/beta hydrolase [Pseudolabrys sp.]|nr:alpha/beta hydrolase [Pseudolabrys sp.]
MTAFRVESKYISAPDGLRLHVRCFEPQTRLPGVKPVVCLPGLTRTTADFEVLAAALAGDVSQPRRIIAVDYRGRGLSAYDPNPANYSLPVELSDALAAMNAFRANPAVVVGTSRGGILAMLMATVQPQAVAGVVLNDIGPVIETAGLQRIANYVGKLPQPKDYEEAARDLQRLFSSLYPKFTQSDWLKSAHLTYKVENGSLVPTYDPKLATTLEGLDFNKPLPDLWKEFDALAGVPVMVIRGALSDLLSPATIDEMQRRHPNLETLEVPHQGHAPSLEDGDTIARISNFAQRCDGAAAPASRD